MSTSNAAQDTVLTMFPDARMDGLTHGQTKQKHTALDGGKTCRRKMNWLGQRLPINYYDSTAIGWC